MHLSRIQISNFRNLSKLDVQLAGNVVVVGENRVGKSNLLHALRLIFDPALPESARQLSLADFWDGLQARSADDKISISVELQDFENDLDVLAVLTDFRLDDEPHIVRLTYEFRAKAELEGPPSTEDDYEFICYGGENEAKRFGHDLRRRITMDVLPALRDAEGDLLAWRRSPLRPLIENAFKNIDPGDLDEISEAIQDATGKITDFEAVQTLENQIGELFAEMSGPKQDIRPRLGFAPSDSRKLYRAIRLLVDEGQRSISDASLGSANLVFLSLKSLELRRLIDEGRRDHTLLAIEEPEAHLHPHLQRSVYRHIFKVAETGTEGIPMSVFLTTHSPNIASVTPLRSLLLLKASSNGGTEAYSTASLPLSEGEVDDLTRYLDVTRAEMLFARGVLLVEGDAERFLIPSFANALGKPLDQLGISVCSVSGTNFAPYVKFLVGLGIPFAVATDWDPRVGAKPLGFSRALKLVEIIEQLRSGEDPAELIAELKGLDDYNAFSARCEQFGIFTGVYTLEVDLFNEGFHEPIIETLREHRFSNERRDMIQRWEDDSETLDEEVFLSMIDAIGKGRFAQRLLSRIDGIRPPAYLQDAIAFIADRV
jgi:putative ATP-dependent endonuclease of OLD family